MGRSQVFVILITALTCFAWATACDEPPEATTVTVTPSTAELTAFGATAQLGAEVFDQFGDVMPGVAVSWSSDASPSATVDASGLVTAAGNGTATITATAGAASGSATVSVMQSAASVTVSPAVDSVEVRDTVRLTAEAFDENGHGVADAEFAWSSSHAALATVDGSGLVRGLREGATTITATAGVAGGSAEVIVLDPERDALVALYLATDGPNWANSDNWVSDAPLGEWYGVDTRLGSVTLLDLWANKLSGHIPPELGNLANLGLLDLSDNQLSGQIPPELGNLANLHVLRLHDNQLSGPIPPELGSLANLAALYLYDNQLSGPIPPELANLANLAALYLNDNQLSGHIPPELANLADLELLVLSDNRLSGRIPPELGNLANLELLYLADNQLSGRIPPELGNLGNLDALYLHDNELSGSIPPELGNLGRLIVAAFDRNSLSGPLPRELGNLTSLFALYLDGNDFTGTIPAEFGRMEGLRELALSDNEGMAGPLPSELTSLDRLYLLLAGGTKLCAPTDPGFQSWLDGVYKRRIVPCGNGGPSMAYLTQAVQSREFPVPLVAGEEALLRVFVIARDSTGEVIPPVRARFYLDGEETHVEDIPGKSTPIPTEVDESSLRKSANAPIGAEVIEPGLEMVIEVDPEGTLDEDLLVTKRIPETGRLAVDVRTMPTLDVTVIPFVWSETHDSSIVDLVESMADNPEGHEMLQDTRTLLPIGDLEVTAHAPVLSTSNNAFDLLRQTSVIQTMEGGTGHYKGMMSQPVAGARGVAQRPGRLSFSTPEPFILAHELGHNLNLLHAPCGGAGGPDPSYPYRDGSIGAWGYDFRDGGSLVKPSRPDLMGYCAPTWIGDYHFTNALRFRLREAEPYPGTPARSLLLWGGVGADGVPFLEPAFVVETQPTRPRSGGEYRLTGRTGGGAELFSLSFSMPEVADGDGSASFAFTLPVHPGWEHSLAAITLSGPGGSATLDAGSDRSVVILRNASNGQVRAILRDLPESDTAEEDVPAGLGAGPGLEVLFGRGIPDSAAWRL